MLAFSTLPFEQIYDYFAELFILYYLGMVWTWGSKFYTAEEGADLQSILLTYTETLYYIPDTLFESVVTKVNSKRKVAVTNKEVKTEEVKTV